MIKNYFKIALRNIRRYSTYSILNISGMAIGMACSILLLLWVEFQFSYDRYYKMADRLYRVLERNNTEGKLELGALTTYPLAATLKADYPEIVRSTAYQNFWETFIKGDNLIEGTLATVDKDFFEMFDITFVHGDKNSALAGPNDIIITEDMANRYFGKEDPLGKTMKDGPDIVFTVTGVIKNVPRNSYFFIDCLVSSEFLKTRVQGNLNDWKNASSYTFIELKDRIDSKQVEEKIKSIIQKNLKESKAEIFLQNIKRIHLYSQGMNTNNIAYGNIVPVRLAALIAVLILTIVCINFMNLLTAQSSGRSKEIGVRKIAGANKRKIVMQFLGESLLIVFVAHIIAMILVELLLPVFNTAMYINLEVNYQSLGLYIVLITVIVFCGFVAGGYPALYMSSLQPSNILKGVLIKNTQNAKFRRILVISQFTLSFLFIISTLIIKSQLNYMNSKNFGADIDNVCYFEFDERIQRETIKNELNNLPNILSVTNTDHQYILNNWTTIKGISWKGKKEGEEVLFNLLAADKDYAKTFHLELKEGSYLSADEYSTDNYGMVINEKAAEIFGFKDPIGETIISDKGTKFTIIGVLKNFHFKTFHFPIDPLLIVPIHPSVKGAKCYIRMNSDSIATTVKNIRNTIKTHNPDYPLKIVFLKDDYNLYNRIEMISGTMFGYFMLLTIMISILGLIGLSTFMTVRRTKEIGIRKVNGAKSFELFYMLSKEYFGLVTISFLIASPIAWFATNIWLRSFAYRIHVGWWLFALAWIIVMTITMLTVGLQSYRAASKNPVEALRYE